MRGLGLTIVAVAGLLVSACGFTPIYGDGGAGGSSLSRIAVTTQDDRLGYRVREQLEDALGRDASRPALWTLQTSVDQSRRPLGRRIDDTATRYELTVKGSWTLTRADGHAVIDGPCDFVAIDEAGSFQVVSAKGDSIEDAVSHLGWEPGELAVVGSSRLAQPRRLFLGSTAAKMLHELPVPMIVVPRTRKEEGQK